MCNIDESNLQIDIDEFNKYKKYFTNLPDSFNKFLGEVKVLQSKNKKTWKRHTSNWIVKKKLNQDDNDKLNSNFKSILNKISDNNFDEISQELLSLDITTSYNLEQLVELIFLKAIREDKYSDVYVKLCTMMYNKYVIDEDEKKTYFRVLLLTKCQETFVSSIKSESELELKNFGLKNKLDFLGLLKLIGGLYNLHLITNSIIYDCLVTLTVKVNEIKWYSIDGLCTLLRCVKDEFSRSCPGNYDKITKFLKDLIKDKKKIKAKDRFAIMDVLEI